ncbi:hypothetical protein [Cupriavidus alkaliphilus]|uniref:hypothetical protein n=1 Tax=Cupriavidus alkaliphilus TaxID=942866 RepID=UPI00161E6B3A|nr:hypothetical protein [Cupriavidus alkaliphilus]MBB3014056.1 hypothetical protein [Cupriavidus alkaliphilus]
MQLNNIRLPFDVDIQCRSGACWLRGARRSISLRAGESVRVRAFRCFDMETLSPGRVMGSDVVHLAIAATGETEGVGFSHRPSTAWTDEVARPLTLQISKAVFATPDAPWSRAYAAAMLDLSPRELSARMLKEGGALTDLICEQRLMRVFFELSHARGKRAKHGFASRERRDTAFFDRFGVCVEQLAMIGHTGRVSWSGPPSGVNAFRLIARETKSVSCLAP